MVAFERVGDDAPDLRQIGKLYALAMYRDLVVYRIRADYGRYLIGRRARQLYHAVHLAAAYRAARSYKSEFHFPSPPVIPSSSNANILA